jgi:uncharacterized protein YwqG
MLYPRVIEVIFDVQLFYRPVRLINMIDYDEVYAMENSKFLAYTDNFGLQRVAKQISLGAEQIIRIKSIPTSDENIPVGASKFGGNPDVPNGFRWPEWNTVSLAFIIQINLAEIPNIPVTSVLPTKGVLSFFYHPDQETWGFDPKDVGSWRTYYFQEENLKREPSPEYKSKYMEEPYTPCSANFLITESIPHPDSAFVDQLDLSEREEDAYWELYEKLLGSQARHQLLGNPDVIQNPMELECELTSNGIYTGNGDWLNHPEIEEYRQKSKDWRLLLQVDSDDNAGMMWGDVGMLYYWLKDEKLRKEHFADTWMILQCS